MAQIFISYSRSDEPFITQFVLLIRRVYKNDSLWFDEQIHGGADWWQMILGEISQCKLFIYLISNESLQSTYCQAELREALRLNKQILPVIVRRLNPAYPGHIAPDLAAILRKIQYVDMANHFRNPTTSATLYAAINRLLRLVPEHPVTPTTMTPTPEPQVEDKPKRLLKTRRTYLIGVFLLLTTLAIIFVLSQSFFSDTPTSTPKPSQAAQLSPSPTSTDEPSTTPTDTAIAAIEPTLSEQELETQVALQMEQILIEVEQTAHAAETGTAVILAVNAQQTVYADQTQAAQATNIALSWTPTPTPDLRLTAEARLTATEMALQTQAARDLTATATLWTPTPTLTPTNTPDPYQIAFTPVTQNADWTPIERDVNGVTMLLVPAGCFDMGSNTETDEQPIHQQCFNQPFWIDKTEVTQVQFRQFGGIQATSPYFSGDNRPVEYITWFEAHDFCALRGLRLPTEAEWEYAARGPDSLTYPWGNEWDASKAISGRTASQGTANVGTLPAGASWVGALDMSGNVWEWTSSRYLSYPYDASDNREAANTENRTDVHYVLRGGSWINSTYSLRAPDRNRDAAYNWGYFFGLRCASSYE